MGRCLDRLGKRGGKGRILVRRSTIEMTADADASRVHSEPAKAALKPIWSKQDP